MRDLNRLLNPKSIAVIGGGVWGRSVITQCQKIGFEGPIFPVHPSAQTLAGLSAFQDISDLPMAPDAVFIGVNRHATIDCLGKLSALGAGGAVCFASGFLEAQNETEDGEALQEALLQAAGEMPFIGPNCYGFVNYLEGAALWPDQHGGVRVNSGVAILTQSSNIAINITMQQRGLPIAYAVTVGNQAQIGMSEIGLALLRDARVTALGLHIEGVGDLRAFEALAAEARRLGKGIVALKVGRSLQAQAATLSHTASLAGDAAAGDALLARLGIGQVRSLPEMVEALVLLNQIGPLSSHHIASLSCSGGEASLIADTALGYDVVFPPLDEQQLSGLRAALGPMVSLANPLDYHTYIWGDEARMTAAFAAILSGDVALACVIVDFPRSDLCDPSAWRCVIAAARAAAKTSGKPVVLLGSFPENIPEALALDLSGGAVVALRGLPEALCAIAVAAFIGRRHLPHLPPPLVLGAPPRRIQLISEAQAKQDLAKFGVLIPTGALVASAATVEREAAGLGFPVVLKTMGLAHKSEANAVHLNLGNLKEVQRALSEMPQGSFLIENMVQGAVVELLLGVVRDPAHGFLLTLAAGGVLTELLEDSASLLLPVTAQDVEHALDSLKVNKILRGFRGRPSGNRAAVIAAVLALQDYVLAHKDQIEEIEINPLIVTPNAAIAADALIRIGQLDDTDSD